MHSAQYWQFLVATLCLSALAGCDNGIRARNQTPDFSGYATLPGLSKTADTALQDELARLTAEGATPAQLDSATPTAVESDNGVTSLRTLLSADKVAVKLKEIDRIYPTGPLVFSSPALERARQILAQHAEVVGRAQAALDKPHLVFHHYHSVGLLADLSVYDTAQLAHRWEALSAATYLADGELDRGEQCVLRMLRLDQALAQQKHVVPRLLAARLRSEALRVLEALVQHRQADASVAARLRDVLAQQLAAWPSDADAWIGDRAQGLHTYEMIRHGYLLSVLSAEELGQLQREAGVAATAAAIQKNLDRDEWFYASIQRELIAACAQPYFERRQVLAKIKSQLDELRGTPDYPLVAGRILLVELDAGHRRQAEDRALCEGWLIALSAATQAPPPQLSRNPLTGATYAVRQEETRVVVDNARADAPRDPIIVPLREAALTAERSSRE